MRDKDKDKAAEPVSPEMERAAAQRARDRARVDRWDLNIAIFLFAVLILVIILLFQGVATGLVAPIAVFGLTMVWLVGWMRGKQLYQRFYDDELFKLEQELKREAGPTIEETIEAQVQKALRERWR